jgi:hypothetical protein
MVEILAAYRFHPRQRGLDKCGSVNRPEAI